MNPCPSMQELESYAVGIVSGERSVFFESHLNECEHCCRAMASAGSHDRVLHNLRQAVEDDPFEMENACRNMMEELRIRRVSELSMAEAGSACTIPKRLGSYRILRELGRGGMGLVFEALHTELEKKVALKILTPERMLHEEAVARFRREMKAGGRLQHPNIVRTTDAGSEGDFHYLAMDLIDGANVATLADRHQCLPIAESCEIIRQAAVGMQFAHDKGLIHRDIKPSNLILGSDGVVRILDMGLATLRDDASAGHLTSDNQIVGTVDYMAPEQATSGSTVDVRTDLYSLAATLFRLLTGHGPLNHDRGDNLLKKLATLATAPIASVSEFRPDLPSDLTHVIDRLLSRDPDSRLQTAQQVADAVAPFAAGHDLRALSRTGNAAGDTTVDVIDVETNVPHSVTKGAANPVHDELPRASSDVPVPKPPVRRWITVAALLSCLLLAAITVIFKTRDGRLVIRLDGISAEDVTVHLDAEGGDSPVVEVQRDTETLRIAIDPGNYQLTLTTPEGTQLQTSVGDQPVSISAGTDLNITARLDRTPKTADSSNHSQRTTPDPEAGVSSALASTAKNGPVAENDGFSVRSYRIYYGADSRRLQTLVSQMEAGQLVVIDTRSLDVKQIEMLKDKARRVGARVVGYLSVGELDSVDRDRFLAHVRSEFDEQSDAILRETFLNRNEEFNSERVDVLSNAWQSWIAARAAAIRTTGVHGLLLDTIDTVDLYATRPDWNTRRRISSVEAMRDLVRGFRIDWPEAFVVQNRGLNLIGPTMFVGGDAEADVKALDLAAGNANNPNAILWEAAYHGQGDWFDNVVSDLRSISAAGHATVLTLGYTDGSVEKKEFFRRSAADGFVSGWGESSALLHESPAGALDSSGIREGSRVLEVSPDDREENGRFRNVAEALEAAEPGDEIRLLPGRYPKQRGKDTKPYVVSKQGITIDGGYQAVWRVFQIEADNVSVRNLHALVLMTPQEEKTRRISNVSITNCRSMYFMMTRCSAVLQNCVGTLAGVNDSQIKATHCTLMQHSPPDGMTNTLVRNYVVECESCLLTGYDTALALSSQGTNRLTLRNCMLYSPASTLQAYLKPETLWQRTDFEERTLDNLSDLNVVIEDTQFIAYPYKRGGPGRFEDMNAELSADSSARGGTPDGTDVGALPGENRWPLLNPRRVK